MGLFWSLRELRLVRYIILCLGYRKYLIIIMIFNVIILYFLGKILCVELFEFCRYF